MTTVGELRAALNGADANWRIVLGATTYEVSVAERDTLCPDCSGSGLVRSERDPTCEGTGLVASLVAPEDIIRTVVVL
jgi:hypothetical protein